MSQAQNAWIVNNLGPMPQPPVVPPGPPVAFQQAAALLPTLADPPGANPQDTAALLNARNAAQQAVAQNDYVNAPQLVADLQALIARVALAVPLQQAAGRIRDTLDNATDTLPRKVRDAYGADHPITARLDAAQLAVRNHTPATNFGTLTTELNAIDAVVTAFDNAVTAGAAEFARLDRLFTHFAAELGDELDDDVRKLAVRFYKGSGVRAVEWQAVCNKAEALAVPDNKKMQALRKLPANPNGVNPAVDVLGRMVLAGIVGIKNSGMTFYESSYDLAVDHFGGSWPLEPKSGSGKLQWLNEWEFHIHGAATRDGGGLVNGFTILAGHIKPSAQERVTGISVTITDQALLNAVEAGSAAAFARWARGKEGELTLSRKKRSKA